MSGKRHDPTANALESLCCGVSVASGEQTMTASQNQSVSTGNEADAADVKAALFRSWRRQNVAAIADHNVMIKKLGVPLSDFRKF